MRAIGDGVIEDMLELIGQVGVEPGFGRSGWRRSRRLIGLRCWLSCRRAAGYSAWLAGSARSGRRWRGFRALYRQGRSGCKQSSMYRSLRRVNGDIGDTKHQNESWQSPAPSAGTAAVAAVPIGLAPRQVVSSQPSQSYRQARLGVVAAYTRTGRAHPRV